MTNLALYGDTHTRGQCESARHTVNLAESALNTLVGTLHLLDGFLGCTQLVIHQVVSAIRHTLEVVIQLWQRLQALDKAVGIVVEYHTLVQQSVRVENSLQLLHHLVGLLTPLVLHKRCHVATCTVLGLQTAVVALYHQLGHIAHHLGITGHLVLIGKALIQDKVVVTLKGMTVDTCIVVAMIGYQLLQLHGSLRQTLDGECHILNQARGANRTCTAYRWEYTATDGPVLTVHRRILGKLGRNIEFECT